jgi:putative endonuclease
MTNDIKRRMAEHINGSTAGFTKKYNIRKLVHLEAFNDVKDAIVREKRLKEWHRAWKVRLIEEHNPDWKDLVHQL